MNERRILASYPVGDAEARMLVEVARHIEVALAGRLAWSEALGAQLVMLISSRRLEFRDGTILGDPAEFQSYVGNREAALIVAALDPLDHGADFWHALQGIDFSSPEMQDMEILLPTVFAAAGIKLD